MFLNRLVVFTTNKQINLPISFFGSTFGNTVYKNDESLVVQKPYLKTNYSESKNEENIDRKNQFGKKFIKSYIFQTSSFRKLC